MDAYRSYLSALQQLAGLREELDTKLVKASRSLETARANHQTRQTETAQRLDRLAKSAESQYGAARTALKTISRDQLLPVRPEISTNPPTLTLSELMTAQRQAVDTLAHAVTALRRVPKQEAVSEPQAAQPGKASMGWLFGAAALLVVAVVLIVIIVVTM